ncbi:MAG: acetylxylan esterase [Planctomycetota bacterium]|nr:acetylxylan esterase [Planctomycetota bacterium]
MRHKSGLIALTAIALTAIVLLPLEGYAQSEDPAPHMFQRFVQAQGRELRAGDVAPATNAEWEQTRSKLRANLLEAWGGFPETACPLEPRSLGEIQRDGYRVEKIVFQTLPGVWMTANAYVPERTGKLSAVLCVHGHWAGAKQDPVVQSRCIGLAKLGFFVLCVDAFGAGERGVGKKLGEYHGEMTAATLFPVGRPLSGLQVYENMRAVDYIRSRPEVDPERIGVTGASGGGNQTMYAGAFDERLHCVVPTCSVGNYQAYLSAACCMCEVVPGALRFTEEGDVLSLAAARGLMVTSATQDAFQFSVGEAKKSFERVAAVVKLYESAQVKHTIIESPHHFNQPMREAMYGWMTMHLKGEGDGSPIAEPEIKTEAPETLRCYPGESRPDDFVTIPRFAAAQAREILAKHVAPGSLDAWKAERAKKLVALEAVLGGMPKPSPLKLINEVDPNDALYFESEPGVPVIAERASNEKPAKLLLLLDLDGHVAFKKPAEGPGLELARKWEAAGWTIVRTELRASGKHAPPGDKVGNAPDHNSAEWSLWIGRPLLGQWAYDVRRTLDALAEHHGSLPKEVAVVGIGTAGPVALSAAALDERISHAMTVDSLASYVTDEPYRGQRLGLMVPGILKDVGDIAHIAALIAPRKVTIAGGVTGGGKALDLEPLREQFTFARSVFSLHATDSVLRIGDSKSSLD